MREMTTLEDCVRFWLDPDIASEYADSQQRLLAELATLRAEAEAWRAVHRHYRPHVYPDGTTSTPMNPVFDEVRAQIARLDQLGKEPKYEA